MLINGIYMQIVKNISKQSMNMNNLVAEVLMSKAVRPDDDEGTQNEAVNDDGDAIDDTQMDLSLFNESGRLLIAKNVAVVAEAAKLMQKYSSEGELLVHKNLHMLMCCLACDASKYETMNYAELFP